MKKIIFTILFVISFSCPFAEPGIPDSFDNFKNWQVFILRSDSNEQARACSLEEPFELCIDYSQNSQKHLSQIIIPKKTPSKPQIEPYAISIALQVDNLSPLSGQGIYFEDEHNIFLMIGELSESTINSFAKGNFLRIATNYNNKIFTYSLTGFAAANQRATLLKNTLSK